MNSKMCSEYTHFYLNFSWNVSIKGIFTTLFKFKNENGKKFSLRGKSHSCRRFKVKWYHPQKPEKHIETEGVFVLHSLAFIFEM